MSQPAPPLEHHPSDFKPTPSDTLLALTGQMLFIRGAALAAAEFVCREMGYLEVMWYWVASVSSPFVIERLALPDRQYVTSASCEIPGGEILRVNRRARRTGGTICAAGHSHGNFDTFTSATDHANIDCLANESVGFRGEGVSTVLFSTHNARGEHWFPVHVRRRCDSCQANATTVHERPQVHVIGDVEISETEQAELRRQLADSVVNRSVYVSPTATPENFQVWRHGRMVGSVSAAVLEEAAHVFPVLGKALGWGCQSSNTNNVSNVIDSSKTRGRDGHAHPN